MCFMLLRYQRAPAQFVNECSVTSSHAHAGASDHAFCSRRCTWAALYRLQLRRCCPPGGLQRGKQEFVVVLCAEVHAVARQAQAVPRRLLPQHAAALQAARHRLAPLHGSLPASEPRGVSLCPVKHDAARQLTCWGRLEQSLALQPSTARCTHARMQLARMQRMQGCTGNTHQGKELQGVYDGGVRRRPPAEEELLEADAAPESAHAHRGVHVLRMRVNS